jgi:iron complex outermembrane receptor protein
VPANLFPVPFDFSFPYQVPSFDVVNLRAGITRGQYSVSAYVKNLTDENYYTGTFDDLFASGVHVRTHPREVGARFSVSF